MNFTQFAIFTSVDHLVLMGIPAKFTTAVEPWMQSFHCGSSAIITPGKTLSTISIHRTKGKL